jgi:hypothetical protein
MLVQVRWLIPVISTSWGDRDWVGHGLRAAGIKSFKTQARCMHAIIPVTQEAWVEESH